MLANQNAIESGGYVIQNSLRFSAASSQYLTRTPAGAGNRKTWTWSGWVKRGSLGSVQELFMAGAAAADYTALFFNSTDTLSFHNVASSANAGRKFSSAVYRDPAAWYHIVAVWDTTNATANDRMILFVNGVRLTSYSPDENPSSSQVGQVNNNAVHTISKNSTAASQYVDGYMTEINFIDGQALTPSSFGETNIETGEWVAKPYTGTYGTNGFYLDFSDGTSTTTLGYDAAGSNDWTLTNFTRSAGVNDCWMEDVPAGNGEASAVQPAGNYAVLNPLASSTVYTLTKANLRMAGSATSSATHYSHGTITVSSGKWYWEVIPTDVGGGPNIYIGAKLPNTSVNNVGAINTIQNGYGYGADGNKISSGVTAYGATYTNNDVIGVALDLDAGTITFYKNNVSQGTAFTGLSGEFVPVIAMSVGGTTRSIAAEANFGQRSFAYTPPTGFKALCTSNLPTPTIKRGDNHFTAKTRTGTGALFSVTGIRHAVDWLFGKSRSAATDWFSYDVNRGVQKQLEFNTTGAETTETTGLTAFNSDGYTGGALAQMNTNAATYIDYLFKAGGAPVSNTAGSITSQVSANPTAGFSVVTYTGNGVTSATVGHGLGVAPKMLIHKCRSSTGAWKVNHVGIPNQWIDLNLTDAASSGGGTNGSIGYQSTNTSTTFQFTAGSSSVNNVNANGSTYVAYCFAEIAGFSKFGSYTGNGSADGTFVFTGFKPRFVMIKRTDSANDWRVIDTARSDSNPANNVLIPNSSGAEFTVNPTIDICSNGFKLRLPDTPYNASGGTYIYAAFAECPINYANAR